MDWLNLRQTFNEVLSHFELLDKVSLELIAFSWSYDRNLTTKFYRPSAVFKNFSFINLLDENSNCVCSTAYRLLPFLDPTTATEITEGQPQSVHVRSMDLSIIQHPRLREALSMGLNHIPLRKTDYSKALEVTAHAFDQLYTILNLHEHGLVLDEAQSHLRGISLQKLQIASRSNKYGFRCSEPYLFSVKAITNELEWLVSHLYVSGLDKASNNPCFLCIRHIRIQAFYRLSGNDFSPCMDNLSWTLPASVFYSVQDELLTILPESPPLFKTLPYLMASYKQHKKSYRWITNAFQTVYSNLASLLTISTMMVLQPFKTWARKTKEGYCSFLRTDTSTFWMVDSIMQVILNLPSKIHDIYVADITRCFESIPLTGDDNLPDALAFMLRIGFREAALMHPKADTLLWIKLDNRGVPTQARWAISQPSSGNWFPMPFDRLCALHTWLIKNCFVSLGDRI
jgi:hypothetical protein